MHASDIGRAGTRVLRSQKCLPPPSPLPLHLTEVVLVCPVLAFVSASAGLPGLFSVAAILQVVEVEELGGVELAVELGHLGTLEKGRRGKKKEEERSTENPELGWEGYDEVTGASLLLVLGIFLPAAQIEISCFSSRSL